MFLYKVNRTWLVYKSLSHNLRKYFQYYNRGIQNHTNFCEFRNFHNFNNDNKINNAVNGNKNFNYYSTTDENQFYDHDTEISEAVEFDEIDINESKLNLKNLLYSNVKNDEILSALNNCNQPSQIFQHFEKHKSNYTKEHITQAILLLWNFKRFSDNPVYINEINCITEHSILNGLLEKLNNYIDYMEPDELTCCYMYLNKLDVDPNHITLRNLLIRVLDLVKESNEVSLSALSRLTVAVSDIKDFSIPLVCKNVLPHVLRNLETCTTSEEIRLITIVLQNLIQLVTNSILNNYKEKVYNLIQAKSLNSQTIKSNLKIINFLCYPAWTQDSSKLIRSLILILSNSIETMSCKELEAVFKIFQNQLEPGTVIPKLVIAAENEFKTNKTPEILACATLFTAPDRREALTRITKEMMKKDATPKNLPIFFKILRSLKISDKDLCNLYWSKVLKDIKTNPTERNKYSVIKHCHRYQHFNNNLGGTYRHKEFEETASVFIMRELETGIDRLIPSKFVKLASFILAYGYNSHIPDMIIDKIELFEKQFTIFDCLQLSRGFQISMDLRYKHFISSEAAVKLIRIENVFNNCAERHLKQSELSLNDINCIIRSLNNRKTSRKSLYKKAMRFYQNEPEYLNSRIIRDITFNLSSSNFLIPEIFSNIFKYIIKNKDYIVGDTVEKILYCSYNLGYIPEDHECLRWSAEIIKRDFNYMSSLSIVQACLALCFYKVIPEDLISRVFNIEFIQRIEEEIQNCYSKATFPGRVLNRVMQLNRAICLDFPETQVPWFQQNYIEAQMSKLPVVKSKFQSEMKRLLLDVVPDDSYLQMDSVTPYGYTIDFVIHLDENMKPVQYKIKELKPYDKISKIAILLLKLDSLCKNDLTAIKGYEQLKMRHLEMLGYKVLYISLHEWNSMFLNLPGAKINFLKNLLQIK